MQKIAPLYVCSLHQVLSLWKLGVIHIQLLCNLLHACDLDRDRDPIGIAIARSNQNREPRIPFSILSIRIVIRRNERLQAVGFNAKRDGNIS